MSSKFFFVIILFATIIVVSCKKEDTTVPVVTLSGDANVVIKLNTGYLEAGATATDDKDGELPVAVNGKVDTNFAGTYYIIYSATDAAGNEGEATRTVTVYNEADVYTGVYSIMTVIGIDTSYYQSEITVSNSLNNRVWFAGFSDIENAAVYADIRHDTVSIPHQTVIAGPPMVPHTFIGSGFIKDINSNTVFEINFTDSVSGNIKTGKSFYTRIN